MDDIVQLLIHGELRGLYSQEEIDGIVARITADYQAKMAKEGKGADYSQVSETEYTR